MIRILERYVLVELLRTFALALLVITFVFLLGTAFRLTRDDLTYWQILRSLPYAVPYTFPYSIPMAFLIAVTLAYGRLVADRELLALESCGISPFATAPPAVGVAVALCLFSGFLQASYLPYCQLKAGEIQRAVLEELLELGDGAHLSRVFPDQGFDLYVRRHRGPSLEGVVIHRDVDGQPMTIVAERGRVAHVGSGTDSRLVLSLDAVTTTVFQRHVRDGRSTEADPIRLHLATYVYEVPVNTRSRTRLGHFSTVQLLELVRREEEARRFAVATGFLGATLIGTDRRLDSVPSEIAFRFAIATAPLAFLIVGLPLTIALRHSNRLVPFACGVGAVSAFFFVPLLLGRSLADAEGGWPGWAFLGDGTCVLAGLACRPLGRRLRR